MGTLRVVRPVMLAGSSAAAMYFFDPKLGRGRRTRLRDRLKGRLRRAERKVEKEIRYVEGELGGLEARLEGKGVPHPADDKVIVDLIRAELHRLPYPTSDVVIEVVEGAATLRGQLKRPEQIREVRDRTHRVPGVREVHSYLHLPGTPPPNKADSLRVSVTPPATNIVHH